MSHWHFSDTFIDIQYNSSILCPFFCYLDQFSLVSRGIFHQTFASNQNVNKNWDPQTPQTPQYNFHPAQALEGSQEPRLAKVYKEPPTYSLQEAKLCERPFNKSQNNTSSAGSRKVTSSPSSARSRLVISEPLQSKMYGFLGTAQLLQKPGQECDSGSNCQSQELGGLQEAKNPAPGAKMWLKKPIQGFRSQMWLQKQRCSCRSKDVAAGAKKWLQESICSCKIKFMATGAQM